MSQNSKIDPKTGDYVIVNGRPAADGTLNTPAYIRTKARRGKWLYAPDNQWGSDYYVYQGNRHTPAGDLAMLNAGQRALQPLVDSGRATSVVMTQLASGRSAYENQAEITQSSGETSTLTFTPVTN